MRYNGKIDNLNHIVISDPSYKKDVWCRYEINDLKEKDWIVDLDINHKTEKIKDFDIGYIEFNMLIKRDKNVCDFDETKLSYLNNINLKEYEIGMDTACVALGINDKAKGIIDSHNEWQPTCSLRTGGDGTFGEVIEGKDINNNLCFLFIYGVLNDYMGYEVDDLKDYLISQFEIKELKIESEKSENKVENNIGIGGEL